MLALSVGYAVCALFLRNHVHILVSINKKCNTIFLREYLKEIIIKNSSIVILVSFGKVQDTKKLCSISTESYFRNR